MALHLYSDNSDAPSDQLTPRPSALVHVECPRGSPRIS